MCVGEDLVVPDAVCGSLEAGHLQVAGADVADQMTEIFYQMASSVLLQANIVVCAE